MKVTYNKISIFIIILVIVSYFELITFHRALGGYFYLIFAIFLISPIIPKFLKVRPLVNLLRIVGFLIISPLFFRFFLFDSTPPFVYDIPPNIDIAQYQCYENTFYIDPEMVERDPRTYRRKCFEWVGKINQIVSLGDYVECSPRVKKISYHRDDTLFCYNFRFGLGFNRDGGDSGSFDKVNFYPSSFLYHGSADNFLIGDLIKIKASVLGDISALQNPDGDINKTITAFIIHDMRKVD